MNISFTSALGENIARRAYQFYQLSQGEISPDSELKAEMKKTNEQTQGKVLDVFKPLKNTKVLELLEKRSLVLDQPELDVFMKKIPTIGSDLDKNLTIDDCFRATLNNLNDFALTLTNYETVKQYRENALEKNKTRPPEQQKPVPVLPDKEDYGWVKLAEDFMKKAVTNIVGSKD